MTVQSFTRVAGCVLSLALLSACASGSKISSQAESSRYRAQARRTYAPPGPAHDPWGPYVTEAARAYDVPERWIREVMRQESGGRQYASNGELITSGAGAMGLMQVMPATYDELRGRYSELGEDPFDPHNNIRAGAAYIREMYDIYGSPGFLAAYNAGPGRLDDYLTRNRTLPEETRRYVASIGPRIAGSAPSAPSPGAQYASNSLPARYASNRYASSRYASNRYAAPRGPVIALNRAPDPTPTPIVLNLPVQLAEQTPSQPADQASPYIVLRPQPVEVAELPPATAYLEPSDAPPRRSFAQVPEPPRASPAPDPYRPPARSQQQLAAASLVPVAPRSRFALVSPANAEPVGIQRGGFAPGNWAVQVGAFADQGLAASAAGAARNHARDVLGGARTSVTPVRQPRGVLYRARLMGMSRDSAAQACERLARQRTGCMIVSPDAQS